jgi:hypothetical protein
VLRCATPHVTILHSVRYAMSHYFVLHHGAIRHCIALCTPYIGSCFCTYCTPPCHTTLGYAQYEMFLLVSLDPRCTLCRCAHPYIRIHTHIIMCTHSTFLCVRHTSTRTPHSIRMHHIALHRRAMRSGTSTVGRHTAYYHIYATSPCLHVTTHILYVCFCPVAHARTFFLCLRKGICQLAPSTGGAGSIWRGLAECCGKQRSCRTQLAKCRSNRPSHKHIKHHPHQRCLT